MSATVSFENLSEEQKVKVAAEVDYFMVIMLRRYGLNEDDIPQIIDSLRWLKEHREFMGRVQAGGTLSLVAMLVSALAAAAWQGVKTILAGGGGR